MRRNNQKNSRFADEIGECRPNVTGKLSIRVVKFYNHGVL